jgi:hypothetical protein
MFAAVQDTRRHWEAVTETTRRIAIAADIELRRRHPDMQLEPLRPHPNKAVGITHPGHPGPARRDAWIQDTLDGFSRPADDAEYRKPPPEPDPSRQWEADSQHALGLTAQAAEAEIPEQVLRIRQNATIAQAKLDELAHTPRPGADQDDLSLGPAWPTPARPDRDAVLQPPQPDIVPSARVIDQHATLVGRHAEAERE